MLHIDATFEDMRIIASSTGQDDGTWAVTIFDSCTGQKAGLIISYQQLTMILAFNLDPNGEPEGFEKFYEELNPLFVGWPCNLRPIP